MRGWRWMKKLTFRASIDHFSKCQVAFVLTCIFVFLKRLLNASHCSKSSFFVQKFNFDFPRKLSIFGWKTRESVVVLDLLTVDNFDFTRRLSKTIGWKTRESVVVLNFLAVDNFDFTRKIVKKKLGKTRGNVGGLSKFFWTKIWLFE